MPAARPLLTAALALSLAATLAACACDLNAGGDDGADAGSSQKPKDEPLREVEPNDAPAQATDFRLEHTAPGSPLLKPYHGELTSKDDVDWFRVPAQSADALRALTAHTDAPGADLSLLWWVDKAPRAQDHSSAPEEEKIIDLQGDAEIVVGVRARAKAFPVAYTLTLARSPQRPDGLLPEPEPAGYALDAPGRLQGFLNHARDVDRIMIRRGDAARDEPALRLELRAPAGVGLRMTLRGPDGDILLEQELPAREGEGPPLRWPNLAMPAEGAPLTLEIAALDPDLPGAREGWSLSALAHGPVARGESLEVEPGPTALLAEGARVLGYLHDPADTDAFTLDLPSRPDGEPPRLLHVRLEGEGMDLALQAGIHGEPPATLDLGKVGQPELICNQVAPAGPWRLQVARGASADATGDRYKLTVSVRAALHEEIEPNQEPPQASAIEPDGDEVRGFIYPLDDEDLWRFTIAAPPTPPADPPPAPDAPPTSAPASQPFAAPPSPPSLALVPVLLEAQAPGINLAVELLDEDGAPVARQDAGGRGERERLQVDLPPGVYFARLKSAQPRAACDEPYRLSLKTR